jgi:hypothetical protein
MSISEFSVEPHILEGIEGSAVEGADLVGVAVDDPPAEIVAAINAYLSRPREGREKSSDPPDNWTDVALPVGSLWGQQMVRKFGWEWAGAVFPDREDFRAIGVFNGDRSLAIYPWHFVLGCVENDATVTILLAFNMLLAGTIPPQGQGERWNVMEHVHHIVPPR